MHKYKVSLKGFRFTAHVGPDEIAHLAPVHRKGYKTEEVAAYTLDGKTFVGDEATDGVKIHAKSEQVTVHRGPDGVVHDEPIDKPGYATSAMFASSYILLAHDEMHAEAVFKKTMGITKSEQEFKVELLPEDTPAPVGIAAPKAKKAKKKKARKKAS